MAFKVAAVAILLAIVAINAAPQLDQLPGGMTTPGGVAEVPVGGNQTNPGELPSNNLNTTVPANPAGGVGGAENATVPSNIGGVPNRLTNRINRLNSNRHQ